MTRAHTMDHRLKIRKSKNKFDNTYKEKEYVYHEGRNLK